MKEKTSAQPKRKRQAKKEKAEGKSPLYDAQLNLQRAGLFSIHRPDPFFPLSLGAY